MQTYQSDDSRDGITKFRRKRKAFVLLFGLAAAYMISLIVMTTYRKLTWVPAPGVVTDVGVVREDGPQADTTGAFYPKVTYQYVVAGERHHGDRFQLAARPSSYRHAMLTAQEYTPGDSVTVHVSPRDPSASVLRKTVEPYLTFMPFVFLLGLIPLYWIPMVWLAKQKGTISSYTDWW